MKLRTRWNLTCAVLLLCAAAVLPAGAAAQGERGGGRVYVQGTMIGVGGRYGGRSLPFNLIINRYTSPGEVQELNDALGRSQDDLLRTLSRMDAGRISLGNNVGVTANAVIQSPGPDGGTKLTVLYERNVRMFEMRYGTRSADYRFGYAEIFLDRGGRGQGTIIPAARVRLRDGNTWEVEDFGEFPARLMGVRVRGGGLGVR
ncbi:MAG TPA: hypothetical protein VGX48_02775 [Pyrinomonadaceae bacterium]|jgi:hypothetical protein|nr:hypothetical protein [Pyrinomonadaceae bacterium]